MPVHVMDAQASTDALERKMIAVDFLEPDPDNPNRMSPREFDLLVSNIDEAGLTDPILVWEHKAGRYRIVGGEHRWRAAKYLGMSKVPCTVITDPKFDEERAQFQLVRHNVIKGRMDPESFIKLYEKVAKKYADDVLQEMFGFAEEAEFRKLIKQTAASLPPEMQASFKEAAKEIKTIDGLAQLLNEMFTKFGDTLPYGYMVVDYGGQDSIWLRVSKKTFDDVLNLGSLCIDRQRTLDDLVGFVLRRIAAGEMNDLIEAAVEATPEVKVPSDMMGSPTADNIAAAI